MPCGGCLHFVVFLRGAARSVGNQAADVGAALSVLHPAGSQLPELFRDRPAKADLKICGALS